MKRRNNDGADNRLAVLTLKSEEEVEKIYRACQVVAEVLLRVGEQVSPGATTYDLNRLAEDYIRSKGMRSAFKGYRGFKHTLCTSINEEVVHGIPSKKRVLRDGDIIGIDCGAVFEGYYGDSARTFACGSISAEAEHLLKTTWAALNKGIEQVRANNRLYDIGAAIQGYAEANGCSVVKEYVGHGIGRELHEDPQIPNFGEPGTGMRLKVGMVFAIEPMLNLGAGETKVLEDGWTVVTRDGAFSAHFEDSVVIKENGPEILTRI